jgi:hypothetical protein
MDWRDNYHVTCFLCGMRYATVELCFLRCSCRGYITRVRSQLRVEAGSNTSTVTLRVVRGDAMGSLKSETVKYGSEYQGTRARERLRWEDPAAYTKDRPVFSSERVPHKNKTVTVK